MGDALRRDQAPKPFIVAAESTEDPAPSRGPGLGRRILMALLVLLVAALVLPILARAETDLDTNVYVLVRSSPDGLH